VAIETGELGFRTNVLGHGGGLYSSNIAMSTNLSVNLTSTLGRDESILPALMKPTEDLSSYIARVMKEEGISNAKELEGRVKASGGDLSDSTINSWLDAPPRDYRLSSLVSLAGGLNRPVLEVVAVALFEPIRDRGFSSSEFAEFYDRYKEMPNGEDKRFFTRQIQNLTSQLPAKRQRK
jgi:hypothetical protein